MKKCSKGDFIKRVLGCVLISGGIAMCIFFGLSFTDIWWDGDFPPIFLVLIGFFAIPIGTILLTLGLRRKMQQNAVEMQREYLANLAPQLLPKVICPYCGAEIPNTGKFCVACGRNVASISCNKCGEDNPCNATFCSKCGERLI